jgi:phosphatidylserine/phosphatidylglycerophosphate/cardiolipin synthase-like enzyme
MIRKSLLHALLLSFVLLAAVDASAALPQDRPFYATIKNSSAGGERCLAFGGNGTESNPTRITWGAGPYCGLGSAEQLLANRQAAWRILPLGNDLYTITNASAEGERCLFFAENGTSAYPSRYNWNAGEYCGFPGGRDALLSNKQAVFRIVDLGDDRYVITNASAGGERCLIFGENGTSLSPSRYNWSSGPYCGFPGGKEALLRNNQAVFRIEPVGSPDILDTLFSQLYKLDGGRGLGTTYSLTTDNALAAAWIVQTPLVWSKEASAVPIGAGSFVADHITQLIASAQQHIDIMTLVPFPTGDFQTAIRRGLEQLATSGRPVTVRILAGWDPLSVNEMNQGDYLRSLIVDIKDRTRFPNNKLQISVAAQRTAAPQSTWNHAKIVAIDGKEMLIGGQNFWDDDYLRQNPVHDLSVRLKGSSTVLGHRYADVVWAGSTLFPGPCGYTRRDWLPALWRAGGQVTTGCLPNPALPAPEPAGKVRVLTVGRLGVDRLITAEASESAMWAAFENTTGPIRIAQQDFRGSFAWDWTKPIVAAVVKSNRPVYIVVGDDGAKGGPPPGKTYKLPLRTLNGLANDLWNEAKAQGGMTIPQLKDRLCSTLSFAPMRFGPSKTWPSGFTFANHSKFWLIDSLFYVGSHNLYPAGLQELGVIVNDPQYASEIKTQYWDPMWVWSKADARSGPDAANCVFRNMN